MLIANAVSTPPSVRLVTCSSWLIGAALALLLVMPATVAQAQAFALSAALARLERAPAVTQIQQKLRQTQAELSAARAQAGFRADFGSNTSYAFAAPAPGVAPAPSVSLQITGNLPLGPFSSQALAVRTAELNLEYIEAALRLTRSDLARRVVRAYGNALITEQQRDQARGLLELTRTQLAALEAQQRLGSVTGTQVLNAQLALGMGQQAVTQVEYNARDARVSLAGLLGLSDLPGAVVRPASRAIVPLIVLPDMALLTSSPNAIFARIARDRARLAAEAIFWQSYPVIGLKLGYVGDVYDVNLGFSTRDFNASATLGAQPFGNLATVSSATISLSASIIVWDGGGGDAARRSATLALEAAQAQLEETIADLKRQLEAALRLAQVDAQALPALRAGVLGAQRSLEVITQSLAAGTATTLDRLAVRVQLQSAEGALLGAELRALEDLYQIDAILGVGGPS